MDDYIENIDQNTFDKLMELDCTAYDHAKDLRDNLDELEIEDDIELYLGVRIEDQNTVIDVCGEAENLTYIDTYTLEGIDAESASPVYRLWANTFDREFENVHTLSDSELDPYTDTAI